VTGDSGSTLNRDAHFPLAKTLSSDSDLSQYKSGTWPWKEAAMPHEISILVGVDAVTRLVGFFVSTMGMGLIFHGLGNAIRELSKCS
jgi:hypothetical protein